MPIIMLPNTNTHNLKQVTHRLIIVFVLLCTLIYNKQIMWLNTLKFFFQWRFYFLSARRYASAGLCDSDVSVRPSVRTSVRTSVCHTLLLCLAERNSNCRIVKCTPSDSPITLVSGEVWFTEKFARGHPKGTCQMRVRWFFRRFSTNMSSYLDKRCILDTKLL